MMTISSAVEERLHQEANIWLATVRPNGHSHLIPIWFVWLDGFFYLCTQPNSVKVANIAHNAYVSLALENGSSPVICEGAANIVDGDYPAGVITRFKQKYNWDIVADNSYGCLLQITPTKWRIW